MGVLEEVMQMKNQGMEERDIINSLQEKKVSQRDINDALSQSKIKSAISEEGMYVPQPVSTTQTPNPYTPKTREADYSPHLQKDYPIQPQEYYPPEQNYPQENYEYYPSEQTSTDTIIEIAEQVSSKNMQKTEKQIQGLNEFKTIANTKIESIDQRLKKIETLIDALQLAILNKVGSYGKNIDAIKKEMSMMQDSFGKVVNQAIKGATHSVRETTTKKRTTKK
ncbi:MAG: hypothetical protein ABH811_00290 [archaeon]